jgi:hypothetical protein
MLVVIATERAAKSPHVGKEIKLYKRTHRGNMSIIPIDFNEAVLGAVWFPRIDGLPPGPKDSSEALSIATPSPHVVERIKESFDFTRRNRRLFVSSVASLGLLLTLLALSLAASFYASAKALESAKAIGDAAEAKRAADAARDEVRTQQEAAAQAKREAEKQRGIAEYQAEQAKEQTERAAAANKQRAAAEKATEAARHAAEVARRLEEEAKKEATKQQEIAESQRLTAEAIESLPIDPGQSVQKATEAVNTWQTEAPVNSLRRSLHAYRMRTVMEEPGGNISSTTFSRAGNLLVTVGPNNVARVRDAGNGRVISELRHTKPVLAATFSRDGKLIVTGSQDNTACVWDAQYGTRVAELNEHKSPVTSVAFSPTDNNLIATDSRDSLLLWNIASKGSVKIGQHISYVDNNPRPTT